MGISRMFGDRQVGGVAEDLIEEVVSFPICRDDDLRSVDGVLVGDVGVGGDSLADEVARQVAGGQGFEDSVPEPKTAAIGSW